MKIPETLSTKSVAIGFLGFLILIGIVLGCIFMAGHERKGDKEGRNSRNEMMEGNGHRDRFEGRDSEKNNNDDSENGDQENVQSVSKQDPATSQALSGSASSGVSLSGSTTPSSTLIGTGGNQSSKK